MEVHNYGRFWKTKFRMSPHGFLTTRWYARVDSVSQFAEHLPLIKIDVLKCQGLNLTAECKAEVALELKSLIQARIMT